MRRVLIAGLALVASAGPSLAKKIDRDTLVQVVAPLQRGEAAAHPFVNVIVRFGASSNGADADPASFRARVGGHNVTDAFVDEIENGKVIGKRARLQEPDIQNGHKQKLRLSVRSVPKQQGKGSKTRVYRDTDVVKFKPVEAANGAPTAHIATTSDVILAGIPIKFDGDQSQDPDGDELTYAWDFGDGTTSTDAKPSHSYAETDVERVVTLVVSDGQVSSAAATVTLLPAPPCDDGTLPGRLHVDADSALEFGAVAPGAIGTKTFTITNTDSQTGSQIKVSLGTDSPLFTLEPSEIALGPNESMPVTVTFAPTATGHQSARIGAVACAAGTKTVAFLSHGYGGDAPDTGPTFSSDPLYYSGLAPGVPRFGMYGILPGGQRFDVDNSAKWCVSGNNTGTRDLCYVDADCQASGEHCVDTAPINVSFDPSDFCGDGLGNLFILSEDTVLDPSNSDNEITGSIVRLKLDDAGNRTAQDVVKRISGTTTQMACDSLTGANGGTIYMAEYHYIDSATCVRDARESLTGIRKGTGAAQVIGNIDRIDAFEVPPLDICEDDYDPVTDLAVSADGSQVFMLPENGGIYRIRPTPLFIVQPNSPLFKTDRIQVGPDGAVYYATASDSGTTGTLRLYKIFPEQAETGALSLDDLTPCATFSVPNNRPADKTQSYTIVTSFATDRGDDNGNATTLVNFGALGGTDVAGSKLRVLGTVAFSSASGSTSCTTLGLENLELYDSFSF